MIDMLAFKKERVIYEKQTKYNKIKVVDDGKRLKLTLDETGNIHSLFLRERISTGSYWDICALISCISVLAKERARPSLVILGAGGGSISRIAKVLYPSFCIFGVDIDIEVIRVGLKFFDPRFDHVVVADYEKFMNLARKKFDVIVVDVFLNASIPFSFFLPELWEILGKKGNSVVVNTILMDHAQHIRSLAKNFFPFTTIIKNPESSNFILFCSHIQNFSHAYKTMRKIIADKTSIGDITAVDEEVFLAFLSDIEESLASVFVGN